jgi:hypothetical protein
MTNSSSAPPLPPAPGSFADAFTGSLLSNLAPLITLFGEQISKQFLSQARYFEDSIAFATVPVGILSAVVSAIRIGGSKILRTIIGREVMPQHYSCLASSGYNKTNVHPEVEKVEPLSRKSSLAALRMQFVSCGMETA